MSVYPVYDDADEFLFELVDEFGAEELLYEFTRIMSFDDLVGNLLFIARNWEFDDNGRYDILRRYAAAHGIGY